MKKHIKKALVGILAVSLCASALFACTGDPTGQNPDGQTPGGQTPGEQHTHDYTSVVTDPTCTVDGYTTFTCACGETYKDNVVSATGHKYVATETVKAICGQDGYTLYVCSVCDADKQDDVVPMPAESHAWGDMKKVRPTCGTEGYDLYVCTVCEEEDHKNIKPATGKHTFDNETWAFDTEKHWHPCTVCGSKDSEAAHTLEDNACTVCDYEKLTYRLNEDGNSYTLVRYDGKDEEFTVPSEYNGKPVTGLGATFANTNVKKIILPASVKTIENGAFVRCKQLTSVNLDGVTSIGIGIFNGCENLETVTLPAALTTIPANTFAGCTALKSIIIPANVTTIGGAAFKGCTSLTSITLPESVTFIGHNAFEGSGLTSLTIGNTVATVEYQAFKDCAALTTATVGSGVATLAERMFEGCENLTTVTLPASLTEIGEKSFYGCKKLTAIDIPAAVKTIGAQAFRNSGLTAVTLNVETVGQLAFAGCTGLQTVTVGQKVAAIGVGAFRNCENLAQITVTEGNTTYSASGNCLIETATNTLVLGCKASVIPTDGSVTAIGEYAFAGSGLTELVIPDSVTTIGASAFETCSSLAKITLGTGLTNVGSHAFYDCSALVAIVYNGSQAQWGNVEVEVGNSVLAPTNYGA